MIAQFKNFKEFKDFVWYRIISNSTITDVFKAMIHTPLYNEKIKLHLAKKHLPFLVRKTINDLFIPKLDVNKHYTISLKYTIHGMDVFIKEKT